MKTYVEILHSADGEKASKIFEILTDLGLQPSFGQTDFVYCWKNNVYKKLWKSCIYKGAR